MGTTPQGFRQWVWDNAQDHIEIVTGIHQLTGTALNQYIIDPFPEREPGVWLATHQSAHDDMNQFLGLPGNNLQTVDFKNRQQLEAWLWLHWQEHAAVRNAIGI